MICGMGLAPKLENQIVISPSKLAAFIECPSIYEWQYILGNKETSKAMDEGTMIHEAILEPEVFAKKYAHIPVDIPDYSLNDLKAMGKEKGIKGCTTKAQYCAALKELNPEFTCLDLYIESMGDKVVLTQKQSKMIEMILARLKKDSDFYNKILPMASKEELMHYTHETGVVLQFKCDAVLRTEKMLAIFDVKTSNDITARKFDRENFDMCRDVQAAAYIQGIEQIFNQKVNAFGWLAIETTAPYRFDEITPDEAMLEAGKTRLDHYLREFLERHQANDWSPRQKGIRQTSLMAWNWEQINELGK